MIGHINFSIFYLLKFCANKPIPHTSLKDVENIKSGNALALLDKNGTQEVDGFFTVMVFQGSFGFFGFASIA